MNRATYNAGFSLVEILVGMVIGLLGVIIIMQIFAVAEGQKRTTTSGADAQTNGNIALFTIERDTRQAGYGMSLSALGCKINTYYNGSTTIPGTLTLAPVVIGDGGVDGSVNALPDTLQLLYSTNAITSLPQVLTFIHPQPAAVAFINSNFNIAVGDMVVFYEAGKDCTLAQVTNVPSSPTNIIHASTSPWNASGGGSIFPVGGYNVKATVFNFGSMVSRNYSIDTTNNNLQVFEILSNGPVSTATTPLAGEIVNLQAQYGKDRGLHPGHVAGDAIVDTWDFCTPGTAGCPADTWGMVVAVRIAILARSGQYEKPTTGGVCTATTAAPSWTGGTMAVQPAGGGLPSCYRYKVFESVVPLRNIIWG